MKRPAVSSVIGVAGSAVIIIATLSMLNGIGQSFDLGPYEDFVTLMTRLGYQVIGEKDTDLDPTQDVVLALGNYIATTSEQTNTDDDGNTHAYPLKIDALRDFVRASGFLISAGDSGVADLACDDEPETFGKEHLSITSAGPMTIKSGILQAESAIHPVLGAITLAETSHGAYIVSVSYGTGSIVHFANDDFFRSTSVLNGEASVFVNEILVPHWGKNLVVFGRLVGKESGLSFFRLLSAPKIGLFGLLVFIGLAVTGVALAFREGGVRNEIPSRTRSALTTIEVIGDFYRKNTAVGNAERFLATRFKRRLLQLAPASHDAEEAAVVLAPRAGIEPALLLDLSTPFEQASERDMLERKIKRAACLIILARSYRKG